MLFEREYIWLGYGVKHWFYTSQQNSAMSSFLTHHLKPSPNREQIKKTHSPQTSTSSLLHLCLPKPLLHHTLKLTAIEVAGVVHGAWKHIRATVSHNPKVCFSLFPNLDFELLMGLWVFLEPHELFMVFFFFCILVS